MTTNMLIDNEFDTPNHTCNECFDHPGEEPHEAHEEFHCHCCHTTFTWHSGCSVGKDADAPKYCRSCNMEGCTPGCYAFEVVPGAVCATCHNLVTEIYTGKVVKTDPDDPLFEKVSDITQDDVDDHMRGMLGI